jgi:hypothetical protein
MEEDPPPDHLKKPLIVAPDGEVMTKRQAALRRKSEAMEPTSSGKTLVGTPDGQILSKRQAALKRQKEAREGTKGEGALTVAPDGQVMDRRAMLKRQSWKKDLHDDVDPVGGLGMDEVGELSDLTNSIVSPINVAGLPSDNWGYSTGAADLAMDREGKNKGDATVGANTDIAIGVTGAVSGLLGMKDNMGRMVDPNEHGLGRSGAFMKAWGGGVSTMGATTQGTWGAMDLANTMSKDSVSGNTIAGTKAVGDSWNAIGGGLAFLGGGLDYANDIRKTELSGESKYKQMKKVGKLGKDGAQVGKDGYQAGVGMWKMGNAFAENGGNVVKESVSKGAIETGKTLSAVGGGLSVGIGALQMGHGGFKIGEGLYRYNKLNKMSAQENDRLKGNDDILDHLKGKQKDQMKGGAWDMAKGAGSVVAGALILSGVGAIPGMAIGAGIAAVEIGRAVSKKFTQSRNDKRDRADQLLEQNSGDGGEPDYGATVSQLQTLLKDKTPKLKDMQAAKKDLADQVKKLKSQQAAAAGTGFGNKLKGLFGKGKKNKAQAVALAKDLAAKQKDLKDADEGLSGLKAELKKLKSDLGLMKSMKKAHEGTGIGGGIQKWWSGYNHDADKSTRKVHAKKVAMAERLLDMKETDSEDDKTGGELLSTVGVNDKNWEAVKARATKKWGKLDAKEQKKYGGSLDEFVHAERMKRILKKL